MSLRALALVEEKKFKHSPREGTDNPLGPISLWSSVASLKESLQPLALYISFHDLMHVYSCRSGADNPRGQNFVVHRNLLSLRSFATSF